MKRRTVGIFSRWFLRISLAWVIAIGIGYLPYHAYGPSGVGRAMRLRREAEHLRDGNARLRRENVDLRAKIIRMRNDPKAAERVARDELGLVGPNDLVFQFE